jgi:lipopolysaccharide/colanic/teichoic acid biosynthesis glycosyltransferase/glycosyltransferase involved in cell wall biosynthesis
MLRILHVVEALGGGIHTFFVGLINRQCDDFEVYVAYGIRPFTHKNFKDFFDKRVQWIRVHHFQRSVGLKDIRAFFELKRILREVQPDIVHLHSSKAGFLGRWALNCSRYKVFYTPNGFSFLIASERKWKRWLYRLIEYVSAQRDVMTIACGKGEYEEALKLSVRCTYVNNGINIHELAPFLPTEYRMDCTIPVICTSGRILYQKNPRLFNEIAFLLPYARFIWIGDGEMHAELTAPNVEVTGWLKRKEALHILAGVDFFLLPSLWEGLPLSLLEAMYLKKVCLVSDVSGNREVIEDGRNGFVCHTAEEYALRISQVLQDESTKKNLTHHAHEDVLREYNTNVMASGYKSIYNGNYPKGHMKGHSIRKRYTLSIKRYFDIVFSTIFLLTLFPITYVVLGAGIKLSSLGPVFFRQKRTGLQGQEFWCMKFRSMRVNEAADTEQAAQDDPRITRFGHFLRRTHLDELPQFINVFRGEMSVVGPRPHMLKHTEYYADRIEGYMLRHEVRPGVTGWAQVTGFSGEVRDIQDMEGRVARDIWYIQNQSFLLDIRIVIRTTVMMFRRDRRAY